MLSATAGPAYLTSVGIPAKAPSTAITYPPDPKVAPYFARASTTYSSASPSSTSHHVQAWYVVVPVVIIVVLAAVALLVVLAVTRRKKMQNGDLQVALNKSVEDA